MSTDRIGSEFILTQIRSEFEDLNFKSQFREFFFKSQLIEVDYINLFITLLSFIKENRVSWYSKRLNPFELLSVKSILIYLLLACYFTCHCYTHLTRMLFFSCPTLLCLLHVTWLVLQRCNRIFNSILWIFCGHSTTFPKHFTAWPSLNPW